MLLSKCFFGVDPHTGKQPFIPRMSDNDGTMVNQVGLSRKHILDAVEGSVKRLGTYIDVLQIHRLDADTPREEIMRALNYVVEKGWVRYIGASTVSDSFSSFMIVADITRCRRNRYWRIRGDSRQGATVTETESFDDNCMEQR